MICVCCIQDSTSTVLKSWVPQLEQKGIQVVVGGRDGDAEKGVNPMGSKKLKSCLSPPKNHAEKFNTLCIPLAGYGRNEAIKQSSGKFLCFMDAVSCI